MTFFESFKRAYQIAYYRWRLKLDKAYEIYSHLERDGAIEVKSKKIED